MPVALLSDSTIRAISSSLVLNDACSVVKELVDNALDANATSIIVEISSNTLDVIQVKDNGHGIGVEDRQLVCKRGCTSKIRTIEDLERLGGSSLGFRGEALASVTEISEAVDVTTRVDGEIAGTILKFGRDGALQNSASASHPVGTTFRIQGFLQALPVRKDVAKKAAPKILTSIKKLLYSYAYARPSVRYAFKVLRANNERGNWSYAPKLGSTSLQDTATKIAGQEVAAQCEVRSAASQQTVPQSAAVEFYSVDAVLVKTDAEASKVHNIGHYVSVDGRPVNPTRGAIRNIVKLYKSFYRAASCNALRKPSNVDPFLCMHIRCPPGSYDVNIEPAKDDLLFSEPSKVISLVEKLFRGYYGEATSETLTRSRSSPKHQAAAVLNDNFDLLLARKAVCSAESSTTADSTFATQLDVAIPRGTGTMNGKPPRNLPDCGNAPDMNPENVSLSQMDRNLPRLTNVECNTSLEGSETHFNMHGMDDEDLLTGGSPPPTQPQFSQEAEHVEVRSARVTNPWSLAKLNAPARQNVGESAIQADPGSTIQLMTPGWGQNEAPRNVRQSACPQESTHRRSNLPSPVASSPTLAAYQNPGPPLRWRAYDEQHDQDDADIESTQGSIREASNPRHAITLDRWVQPQPSTMHLLSSKRASISYCRDDVLGVPGGTGFEQQEWSLGNSLSTEPDDSLTEPSKAGNHISKAFFKSPLQRRSIASSGLTANLVVPDSACTGEVLAPPLPKARSPLSHGSPSSQRRSPIMDYNDQSRLMSMPPSLSSSGSSFKISLSTNRELAEILEFEQRKKAAVLHQRRAQSDLAAREPKPVKLANIQRKSNDTPLMQAVSSQTRRALPNLDLREGKGDSARDFERRFAKSSGNEAESVIYRNSPHRSRYLAAKERLDHTDPESDLTQDACQSSSATSNTGDLLSEADVRLSEDDPRTYLARLSENGDKMNSLTGLRKTGLQIRRTKTAQLPLETVPTGAANHNLKAMASDPFPGALPLAVISGHQGQLDEYVGTGENSFIRWSANSRDVAAWEATLNGLISRNFRVRLAGGESVTPEVTVMLRTAIKAHADAHSFD